MRHPWKLEAKPWAAAGSTNKAKGPWVTVSCLPVDQIRLSKVCSTMPPKMLMLLMHFPSGWVLKDSACVREIA